jgi:hypothetical protein
MQELISSPSGLVALGGAALAVLSLLLFVVLGVKLRRLRRAQRTVLGGHEEHDLVAHAERLEDGFVALREMVEQSLVGAEQRLVDLEESLQGCVAHSAVVRYDAYGEMSGRQSSSLALLDSRHSGVVLSSILHRDQARIYVKRVHQGQPELELSPEEREAVAEALGRGSASTVDSNGRP